MQHIRSVWLQCVESSCSRATLTTGVSVLPQHPAVEGAGVDAEAFGHHVTEASGVQVGAAANDAVLWQTAQLPGHIGQHINWNLKG